MNARRIVSLFGALCLAALALGACGGGSGGPGPADVPGGGGGGGLGDAGPTGDGTTPTGCQTDEDCVAQIDAGPCALATCDLAIGQCGKAVLPDGTKCDDGDPCTAIGACHFGGCEGGEALDCDDGEPCTKDGCDPQTGECLSVPLPDGSACDDDELCTVGDACVAGACGGAANPVCQCGDDADCEAFEDSDLCNGRLACVDQQCVLNAASVVLCDLSAAGPCVDVACDPKDGACRVVVRADGSACDDGDLCTSGDTCGAGECAGKAILCDDQNPCTDDSCGEVVGCIFQAHAEACDDGDLCTLGDVCLDGVCAGQANPACICVEDAECAEFEDGNLCNGTLVCVDAKCALDPATVVDCAIELGVPPVCQQHVCQPATGLCATKAGLNGVPCDDQDACTAGDACVLGVCVGQGPAVTCDDGEVCTLDACDPTVGCTHAAVADGAACDDGDPCTAADACAGGVCAGAVAVEPCECGADADCAPLDDDDLCNGTLVCVDKVCVVDPTTVVTCGAAGPCVASTC